MKALGKFLRPHIPTPRWLWVAGACGLAVCVASMRQFELISTESAQMRQQIGHMRKTPPPKPRLTRDEEHRNDQWVKLEAERKFNWYPVFLALEKASSDDIELLEFRPDKPRARISLRGEARDMQALFGYLERLEAQPAIEVAYLAHQKSAQRSGLLVVEFEIQATIRP